MKISNTYFVNFNGEIIKMHQCVTDHGSERFFLEYRDPKGRVFYQKIAKKDADELRSEFELMYSELNKKQCQA